MTAASAPSPLARLRERGVVRVAASYGIIAWLALQIASIVFPALHFPEWSMTAAVFVTAFGFVIACLLAWFLEITPAGIEIDRQHGAEVRPKAAGWRRYFDVVVIGALVIVVSVLLVDRGRRGDIGARAEKSVAVLPFVNMSGDPANEYFSDGLADTVINGLAQLQGLRVTARTSSFQFKDQAGDVRTIGQKLGVAAVIEGSVQRSGDKLRVIVQLISTADGTHLWSKTFDRSSADVFAVQDEIATHTAEALRIALLTPQGTRPRSHGTTNAEAFDDYARARALMEKRNGPAMRRALELLRHAVELDPDFALGYAGLAQAMYLSQGYEYGPDIRLADVVTTAERALELAPDLAEAYVPLALAQEDTLPHERVEALLRKAIMLNPNYAEALKFLSRFVDSSDERLSLLMQAHKLDPLSPIIMVNIATVHEELGDDEQALRWVRRALEVDPQFVLAYAQGSDILLRRGKLAEAARWAHAAVASYPERRAFGNGHYMFTLLCLGEVTAARQLQQQVKAQPGGEDIALNMSGSLFIEGGDEADAALLISQPSFDERFHRAGVARVLLMVSAGRSAEVLALLRHERPTLLAQVSDRDWPYVAATAIALREAGHAKEAQSLLEQVLKDLASRKLWDTDAWQWYGFIWRALLGQTEDAVAAMRTAKEAGTRGGIHQLARFATLDAQYARVWADARVRSMMAEMLADVARQRADYERDPELHMVEAP